MLNMYHDDHDDDIDQRSHNCITLFQTCQLFQPENICQVINSVDDNDYGDDNDDDEEDESMSYVCKSGRIVHRASNQRKASIKQASLDTGKVELVSSVDIFVCLSFGLRPGRAHTACPKSKGPNGLQLVQYYFKWIFIKKDKRLKLQLVDY